MVTACNSRRLALFVGVGVQYDSLTVPSPPVHFSSVELPAVTEVGSVVKASFVVCATAATAKDAPTRRAFAKYILTLLDRRQGRFRLD